MVALGGSSTRKPLPAMTERIKEKEDKLPDDGNSMKRILCHKT